MLPGITAAFVVVAAAVTPVLLRGGDNQRRVAAVTNPTEPSSTTSSSEPAATTTTPEATTVSAVPANQAPTTSIGPRPATTTTTALQCRNSYDPRCGPFRWDPDPGPNMPTTAQVTYTPAHPRVGDYVTFHVTYANSDGPATSDESDINYGDGMTSHMVADYPAPPGGCKTPYGPWTPPDRKAETISFDEPGYPYKAAGTYTVTVNGNAGIDPCDQPPNPYRDPKTATTTITVSP